eukprot:UN10237
MIIDSTSTDNNTSYDDNNSTNDDITNNDYMIEYNNIKRDVTKPQKQTSLLLTNEEQYNNVPSSLSSSSPSSIDKLIVNTTLPFTEPFPVGEMTPKKKRLSIYSSKYCVQ